MIQKQVMYAKWREGKKATFAGPVVQVGLRRQPAPVRNNVFSKYNKVAQ